MNPYSFPGCVKRTSVPALRSSITPEDIMGAVALYYGMPIKEYTSPGRKKEKIRCRQVAIYLISKYTALSLFKIGKYFKSNGEHGRPGTVKRVHFDHTTVIYNRDIVKGYIKIGDPIKDEIEAIERIIY